MYIYAIAHPTLPIYPNRVNIYEFPFTVRSGKEGPVGGMKQFSYRYYAKVYHIPWSTSPSFYI